MEIKVNNEPRTVTSGTTVANLVDELFPEGNGGIAVAINGKIVRKPEWGSRPMVEADDVVVIKAAYGG